jgi:hypothetical protein
MLRIYMIDFNIFILRSERNGSHLQKKIAHQRIGQIRPFSDTVPVNRVRRGLSPPNKCALPRAQGKKVRVSSPAFLGSPLSYRGGNSLQGNHNGTEVLLFEDSFRWRFPGRFRLKGQGESCRLAELAPFALDANSQGKGEVIKLE